MSVELIKETFLQEGKVKDTLRKLLNASDKDIQDAFVARATKKKAVLVAKGKKFDEEYGLTSVGKNVYFTYRLKDKSGSTGFRTRKIFVCSFSDPKRAEKWADANEKKYVDLFKKLPTKVNEAMEDKIDSVVDPVQEALFSLFEAVEENSVTNEEISSLEESLDKEFGL